jgi:hypothetical protein
MTNDRALRPCPGRAATPAPRSRSFSASCERGCRNAPSKPGTKHPPHQRCRPGSSALGLVAGGLVLALAVQGVALAADRIAGRERLPRRPLPTAATAATSAEQSRRTACACPDRDLFAWAEVPRK